ncbi:nucleoside-diphosphate sugar epimerase/dehydratase [Streptococcus thoraltensis]|uniref:polysaccharide biosynthesis protein n=1 Tax=Streptococcus thoraltensis TaxID=55085 RepID=UPI002A7FF876|nr:nucleoside-diphosphate sugar epimerase/dehydratase [Streptococcus thoraltensis]MDY4760929.1 nucleoside-diphosphate sugar epimerase/dehydratase [Streptococcus thoraltensis]
METLQKIGYRLSRINRSIKRLVLIVTDLLMILFSTLFTFWILQDSNLIFSQTHAIVFSIISIIYLIVSFQLGLFSVLTRYTDYKTLINISISLLCSHLVLFICEQIFQMGILIYRFPFLSFIFSTVFVSTPRILWRFINEERFQKRNPSAEYVKTIVYGGGKAGRIFIDLLSQSQTDIDLIGVIDDDLYKQGTIINGVKVLGNRNDLARLVKIFEIKQIVLAIPSLNGSDREAILDLTQGLGVKLTEVPLIEDTILGNISSHSLKEIDIADLLGRKEVVLDQSSLNQYFTGRTVLVTGAGGSIGSEICRQVAKFCPKKLLLLGHGENSIYLINRELIGLYKGKIEIIPLIADIQDRELMFDIMATYKPDIVYHAAAHKHVPLMEYNPKEAVKNNIFGTKNVAEAAKNANVGKFIMVSTDKAVNPPNVMGATKRVAEMIVTSLNEPAKTQFAGVRFGNVLGSRGSVVPLFKEQIAKGGPVTVTDFRMTRYFMTIPEASRLVIQAGHLAKGGEIFVLDMGEPVQILELAKKMIKLSGYTEKEIQIVEAGIRPGEKLYEELLSTEERVSDQIFEKIFVGKVEVKKRDEVLDFISNLDKLDNATLKEKLITYARQD